MNIPDWLWAVIIIAIVFVPPKYDPAIRLKEWLTRNDIPLVIAIGFVALIWATSALGAIGILLGVL